MCRRHQRNHNQRGENNISVLLKLFSTFFKFLLVSKKLGSSTIKTLTLLLSLASQLRKSYVQKPERTRLNCVGNIKAPDLFNLIATNFIKFHNAYVYKKY